ncbi:L-tyrosine/L-tryptophan isonitrile synthase family protein [Kitasatospora sp. NPDC051853]|uniref:L-tyrosine/L-tryptophan isonitrile synthase family protein n=1 Tax=Kitasatospora sp. NPDC051853 TaxID=3364058 RepID=UPI0037AE5771
MSRTTNVLALLLPHCRATGPRRPLSPDDFPEQIRQVESFVAAGEEIVFTLPGFPCKSPSPEKVLGHLPDEGERRALAFLHGLCEQVTELHPPGARMVVCSDGHVFGDLIGVPDAHVDAYADELAAMIRREGLHRLSVFDLRDVYGERSHDEKRALVHGRHAPDLARLREELRRDEGALALYRGITRFLVEDAAGRFTGTRSALQRECRRRAYGVIQRSRAWGGLIAEQHPRAVRLSIHPQPPGSAKFGIRLLTAADSWATPWHATPLHRADGRWELVRRAEAERRGRLVLRDGRPSHYTAA